jgi:methyltransferase
MGLPQWIVLLVAAQRLGELALARRNTHRLIAEGGREMGAAHYPFLIGVHAGWLLALFVLVPADAPLYPLPLGLFLLLQAVRVWIIASLGRYWTTRVIDVPTTPLIRRGPYRWLRHPNYVVVVLELAALPLAFGEWRISILFSLANLIVLRIRLGVENAMLDQRPVVAVKEC